MSLAYWSRIATPSFHVQCHMPAVPFLPHYMYNYKRTCASTFYSVRTSVCTVSKRLHYLYYYTVTEVRLLFCIKRLPTVYFIIKLKQYPCCHS